MNLKKITFILLLILVNLSQVSAQHICGFMESSYKNPTKDELCKELRSAYFYEPKENQMQQLVDKIRSVISIKNYLEVIQCEQIDNALAWIKNGKSYIFYDPQFVSKVVESSGTYWANVLILAHEVGHHYYKHPLTPTRAFDINKERERQADIFAGYILYKLGATLEETQAPMKMKLGRASIKDNNDYHGTPLERLERIGEGYNIAKEGKEIEGFEDLFTFKMGCPIGDDDCDKDEYPRHPVTLAKVNIGKTEVTNQQYCDFLNNINKSFQDIESEWIRINDLDCKIKFSGGQYKCEKGFENHPVVEVNWYGADAYAKWKGGRLPSESEWEFMAISMGERANLKLSGSNTVDDVAWYKDNSNDKIHSVAKKQPNAIGLYDMCGNVSEWVSDCYKNNYDGTPTDGSPWIKNDCESAVIRGGSFEDIKKSCHVRNRMKRIKKHGYNDVGFRVVYDK